jgi:hypothetical protein
LWRQRRQRSEQPDERAPVDYATAAGRHRLADGDVVPVAGRRRYADILAEHTQELEPVPMRMTPGQEHRSGRRRWLL